VNVIRGRMDVGAQEGFHTHASDIVLVHLSGGTIEDTADGKTRSTIGSTAMSSSRHAGRATPLATSAPPWTPFSSP
jgi:hypothetical protein